MLQNSKKTLRENKSLWKTKKQNKKKTENNRKTAKKATKFSQADGGSIQRCLSSRKKQLQENAGKHNLARHTTRSVPLVFSADIQICSQVACLA